MTPLFACKDPHVGKLGVSEITTENKQDSVVRAEFKIWLWIPVNVKYLGKSSIVALNTFYRLVSPVFLIPAQSGS